MNNAYDIFAKGLKKSQLNTKRILLEADYLTPNLRDLAAEHFDEIEEMILSQSIFMVEDDLKNLVRDKYPEKTEKEYVSIFKRQIKKYPRVYIMAALEVCTTILCETDEVVLAHNEEMDERYIYVKADGFIRRVYKKFSIEVTPLTKREDIPECDYTILMPKEKYILGYDKLSDFDSDYVIKEEMLEGMS